jgi:hypothetical protein
VNRCRVVIRNSRCECGGVMPVKNKDGERGVHVDVGLVAVAEGKRTLPTFCAVASQYTTPRPLMR